MTLLEQVILIIKRNKKELILISIMILVGILFYSNGKKEAVRLRTDGIYSLGRISDILRTKSGIIYTCKFKYKNKFYSVDFTGIGLSFNLDEFIYIRFLPEAPSVAEALYEIDVPNCITLGLETGWERLPSDTCK